MSLDDKLEIPKLPEGFEFIKCLGSGAQGSVYLVNHAELYGRCAMKILGRKELLDEARALYHLWTNLEPNERKNPYIATLLNINLDSNPPHILTEFVDGENYLESRLNLIKKVKDRCVKKLESEKSEEKIRDLKETLEIENRWLSRKWFMPENPKIVFSRLRKLAKALSYIHSKGRVHGDIKSNNIVINDEEGIFKLIDFGVSGVAGKTSTLYGAPEVLLGGSSTPSSDVYAFGCFAYRAYTGVPPFQNDNKLIDWDKLDDERKQKAREQILERKLIGRNNLDNSLLFKAAGKKIGKLILRCIDRYPSKRPKDGIELSKIIKREYTKRVVLGKKAIAMYISAIVLQLAILPYVDEENMILTAVPSENNKRDIVMGISGYDFTLDIAVTEKDEFNPRWAQNGVLYRRENELVLFSPKDLRTHVIINDLSNEDYYFLSDDKISLVYTKTKEKKTSLYFAKLIEKGFLKDIKLIDDDIEPSMGISCTDKYVFFTKAGGFYVAAADGSIVEIFPKISEIKAGLKKITNDGFHGFARYNPDSKFVRLGFVDTRRKRAFRLNEEGNSFYGDEIIDDDFIKQYTNTFLNRNYDSEKRAIKEFITPWPEYVFKIFKKTSGLY